MTDVSAVTAQPALKRAMAFLTFMVTFTVMASARHHRLYRARYPR